MHYYKNKKPEVGTGYAISEKGERISYEEAYEIEVKWAQKEGKLFAYLSGDGKAITSWPGIVFSENVKIIGRSVDNFGGERIYLRFTWNNEVWSGFAMGAGMYGRFKRTKLSTL